MIDWDELSFKAHLACYVKDDVTVEPHAVISLEHCLIYPGMSVMCVGYISRPIFECGKEGVTGEPHAALAGISLEPSPCICRYAWRGGGGHICVWVHAT